MSEPKLKSFKSFLYNPSRVSDLSQVVTPPYDVIHPKMQLELYDRSDYNFVRVDLAKEEGDKRYRVAAATFKQWVADQVFLRDEKPAFYFHHQTFVLPDGRKVTRKGFFGVRRVEDATEGGVKPHERTLEGPKADRLKLTKALQCNMSPIFSLYSDPEKVIDSLVDDFVSKSPIFDFTAHDGQRHQLWRVNDPEVNQKVSEFLNDQAVFIADGHHRYETALNYRNECRGKNPPGTGSEPFNYVLMYLSNRNDEGLVILPIHRALHNLNINLSDVLTKLEGHFKISKQSSLSNEELLANLQIAGRGSHAMMLISKDPEESYLIQIEKDSWLKTKTAQGLDESLRGLDVSVLHNLIFEEILGISKEAQANQENVIYWKDTKRAIDETRQGNCEVTFLLNPTHVEDMEAVANAGQKMPQKSTFFYPKILSGLVINPLYP